MFRSLHNRLIRLEQSALPLMPHALLHQARQAPAYDFAATFADLIAEGVPPAVVTVALDLMTDKELLDVANLTDPDTSARIAAMTDAELWPLADAQREHVRRAYALLGD